MDARSARRVAGFSHRPTQRRHAALGEGAPCARGKWWEMFLSDAPGCMQSK